jgi:glutathione peroxidase-family protein
MVVNVASECGFTDDHYTQLQKMLNVLGRDDKAAMFTLKVGPVRKRGSMLCF